ncbi:class I SAM-dependent methyltransferase [Xenorhabdus bovienii]|uniref:class I SAM-dependent methyltransferase n=1 Tax=Xenorhabdus bovienii TaxID=40576 RepID=UPI0023B23DED|nr:class I SAM-dependent methyltransferase [Xenorhabdus bovienii]MDE9434839.1 class I SAM-dependent methyltransferase [Xenorhabdus bovienii]MDE9499574.1 class I SAM-dependent methyltransferase [Xenorhabdus bovienii]
MSQWKEKDIFRLFSQYDNILEEQYGFTAIYNFIKQHSSIKKVLDLGCGSGELIPFLTSIASQVVGADISEHALEYAREKHKSSGATFIYTSELPNYINNNSKFDAVISSFLLCTLNTENSIKLLLRQVNDALIEHGYYIVLNFNLNAMGVDFGTFKTGEEGKIYHDGEALPVSMQTKSGEQFTFNDIFWSFSKLITLSEEMGFFLYQQSTLTIPQFTISPFTIFVLKKKKVSLNNN